jgi:hypothetical protein
MHVMFQQGEPVGNKQGRQQAIGKWERSGQWAAGYSLQWMWVGFKLLYDAYVLKCQPEEVV